MWRSALPTRAFSGPSIVRLQDTARRAHDQPPANEHPAYLAKYTELIAAISGTRMGRHALLGRAHHHAGQTACLSPRRGPTEQDGRPPPRRPRSQAAIPVPTSAIRPGTRRSR